MDPKLRAANLRVTESWRSKDSIGGRKQQKHKLAMGKLNARLTPLG